VQTANMAQLYPILHDLVNTTFFRIFRVGKKPKCAYWKKPEEKAEEAEPASCAGGHNDGFAGFGFGAPSGSSPGFSSAAPAMSSVEPPHDAPCGIDGETEQQAAPYVPTPSDDIRLDRSMTAAEQVASRLRDNETNEPCEFEEDLPTYWMDMCSAADHPKGSDAEDINLIKNPERNTGYNGSHIWEAMYKENCYEVGSHLPRGQFGSENDMCYEERVLYRLLSGWHASTTISICKSYYAPGTRMKGVWAPNAERYMESLGTHPERVKNLHFSFVVMLRAIKKAAPFLQSYNFPTGHGQEGSTSRNLMNRLLDSQVLSLCSPLFDAFDETRLFKDTVSSEDRAAAEQRSRLKRQFKSTFKNITALVDCVECQRCRLHAKLFSLGLGSALKILLTPPELIASTTSRDEVIALVNVLWKLSEAMEDARELTNLYWKEHAKGAFVSQKQGVEAPLEAAMMAAPPATAPAGPASSPPVNAEKAAAAAHFVYPSAVPRETLLDVAIGAVKRAVVDGHLSAAQEQAVLRSLVVAQPKEEVLLLAKHYGSDQPSLFARLALEAASSPSSSAIPKIPTEQVVPSSAALGTVSAPAEVIVIGGGLAGMAATLTLLDRGARVVMVDKQPFLGGNSGKASSGINAALNTSVESLVADTTKSAGVLARPALIDRLAKDSAEAVAWLRDRTGVDLSLSSQLGGHTAKRTLRPSNAFVGAELTFAIGEILKSLSAERPQQFRLLTKTKWTGLHQPEGDGKMWRVTVKSLSGSASEEDLQAPSVVIASGGFGHDIKEAESYMKKHRPDLEDFPTTLGAQTTGDGLKIASNLGAALVDMDRVQLHPTGFVDPNKPEEHTKTLAAELLRGVGGLLLDRNGRRFADELGTRQAVVNAMLRSANSTGLSGQRSRQFSIVLNGKAAAMADRHATLYSKKGLLKKVTGIDGLAAHLGMKVETLWETFEAYNVAAYSGQDSFGRKVFPNGHWPVERSEDFYVGTVTPVIHYTMGGIAIDTDGRALSKATNSAIPGLYVIGEASGGVHGDNRLAGNSLLECTVFGHHVGLLLPTKAETAATALVPPVAAAEDPSTAPSSAVAKVFTLEELAASTKEDRKLVALYGKVYDLTEYVEEHPGGPEAITDVTGTDGTETFETVHNKELLAAMGFEPVGDLAVSS
jgi:flavocytochrome c